MGEQKTRKSSKFSPMMICHELESQCNQKYLCRWTHQLFPWSDWFTRDAYSHSWTRRCRKDDNSLSTSSRRSCDCKLKIFSIWNNIKTSVSLLLDHSNYWLQRGASNIQKSKVSGKLRLSVGSKS